MYLDELDKNTTRHTIKWQRDLANRNNHKITTASTKKKSMAQANVKHNINTNLQSCNNFLQFFSLSFSLGCRVLFYIVYLANSLILMRVVFSAVFFLLGAKISLSFDDRTWISLLKFYLKTILSISPHRMDFFRFVFASSIQFNSYCRTP